MDILYFIYFILYIIMMAFAFSLSAVMLCPATRKIFRAPVPHIHDTVGKLLIPWGFTYLLFLPDLYFGLSGELWRNHIYNILCMLSMTICLSTSSWMYMSYLQQGVKQRILQPLIILLPAIFIIWYAISPQETLQTAFNYTYGIESLLIVAYYYKLYRGFVRDLKENYSNLSLQIFRCLWIQWTALVITATIFLIALAVDKIIWNIIDIFANIFTLYVLVYTSEHLTPLPENEEEVVEHVTQSITDEKVDIEKALFEKCEQVQLFCNPDLTLTDLARALGTNRTYISQWLATNNTTFYIYINGLRIRFAANLLATTKESISQIQIKSGFLSKTTFRKYFLEHYGCSPTEYRKQNS